MTDHVETDRVVVTDQDACRRLGQLYQEQLQELAAADTRRTRNLAPYLTAHSTSQAALLRQIETTRRFLPHVAGRVLDWGCLHSLDGCLLRLLGPAGLELHGCDVLPPGLFNVFHGLARLQYRQLEHAWTLPYPDAFFDTVISDGVLEHVPNDRLSLAEVYRIIKPGGRFIICCLPNRYSYTEFLARRLGAPHHLRTYSLAESQALLLHSGFCPLEARHYQMIPSGSGANAAGSAWFARLSDWAWPVNWLLERLWPLNRLASNLYLVAEKRGMIVWCAADKTRAAAARAA